MPAVVKQPPGNPEEKEQESPAKLDGVTAARNLLKEARLKYRHLMDMLNSEVNPTANKDPALKEPEILFKKKLEYGDVHPGLDRLVFKRCSAKLKAALEITPSIRVSTVEPNNKVEHTSMLFKSYVVKDLYTLCRDWRQVVTKNALKVGDSVTGFGFDVGGGEFRVKFYIQRDEKKEAGRKTLLLLGKDPKTVRGRVVINCTSKEVGELVVAGQGKMERCDEKGGDFARFSAKGANGVKYEWSEDGLSKCVNGALVGDGELEMRVDVYKGLRH